MSSQVVGDWSRVVSGYSIRSYLYIAWQFDICLVLLRTIWPYCNDIDILL